MISSFMAKPHETNPINSCFLGCFGFSAKKKSQKNNTRSVSWPRFRLSSRKSSTKTVPVNNTDSKTKKKPDSIKDSSKPHKPSRRNSKGDHRRPPFTDQVARETAKEVKKVISVRFYSWISLFQTKEPKGSPSEPARTGSSLPASPKTKPKKTPTRLSHTVSLLVPERSQRAGSPRIHAPISLRLKNNESIARFEQVMGISIIMVTLITMVLWDRLCAILYTSAWLYVCPRFRTRSNSNKSTVETTASSDDLYLNSSEYKKKVVLEGLLQRNFPFTL
ncbi:hypothetical protein F3Y22_tig00005465pilonHSYRG00125 [Hibiscus syriacus]|uniref:Uncharacterized protein n=2 Tax=Hibiscus syriacus TaxID=106335 RepID=A0A6A3CDW6_HIBSY|nr:hypothetical protein F3Y22_tig00005465pilonHSYRG00125 [Hibiscus syriacus]